MWYSTFFDTVIASDVLLCWVDYADLRQLFAQWGCDLPGSVAAAIYADTVLLAASCNSSC
jgi:hypothetical protein